jgi:AbrB family looped-hinge helix DNA binding protein
MRSTLTSKGQATIPKAIRDYLGLKAGDSVKFLRHPDGHVVMLPMRPVTALRGMFSSPHPGGTTTEQMEDAIVDAVVEEYLESVEP